VEIYLHSFFDLGTRWCANRALRRMFGPKREEVVGGWRRLHMRSFITCALHHVITVIKLKRMRWAKHVARIGVMRNSDKMLARKPRHQNEC
jgi:hypothetical protein